jgi:hypothetical protein
MDSSLWIIESQAFLSPEHIFLAQLDISLSVQSLMPEAFESADKKLARLSSVDLPYNLVM